MAIINPTIFAAGGGVKASLVVSTEKGAVVTAVNGSNVVRGVASEGVVALNLPVAGTWSVTASMNGETVGPEDVVVSEEYPVNLNFRRIYGISRTVTSSSTVWDRTDDAVGMTATASVGPRAGHSDFDSCYPWSEMRRETLSTGDVMVYIPEFWYQRYVTDGVEYIRIADKAIDNFAKHPGSGLYVGAYKTSSDNKSVSGAVPTRDQAMATMRTNARAKGTGWGLIDAVANSAIQMLFLVEFATNDGQTSIGRGHCDGDSYGFTSGGCDGVPNLTGRPTGTDGKVDVVYRGIEGIWGNIEEMMDGIIRDPDTKKYYVCTDPSNYADTFTTEYMELSYTSPPYSGYIIKEGLDDVVPWAMYPSSTGSGGSESTHYSDYYSTSIRVSGGSRSGAGNQGSHCGLFCMNTWSGGYTHLEGGSRLLYRPS